MRRRARQKLWRYLGAAIFAIALSPAAVSYADPSGCSKAINGWGVNGDGELYANGEGYCGAQACRIFHTEIKQDIAWQPDPVAVKRDAVGVYYTYYAYAVGCDHGNYATYYGRVFFDGYTDYLDSNPHQTLQSC